MSSTIIARALLVVAALHLHRVLAADPDITTDFVVPAGVNASTLDGSFFTSTTLRPSEVRTMVIETSFKVTTVNSITFPALEGLGVSFAKLTFPPKTLNSPHTHPRGSEVLYLAKGVLVVGFIDSANELFTQTLHPGDLFVFPKGLVHFQYNGQETESAVAFAGFGSSNAGLIRLPNNLFKSGISARVLEKSFGVSSSVVKSLVAAEV